MTCGEFETWWAERLDGVAADPAGRPAVRDHAAACPDCARREAGYERLAAALARWGPSPAPPTWLAARVVDRVCRDPRPAAWQAPAWVGLAAAAVAVAGLTLALGRGGGWANRPDAPTAPAEESLAARSRPLSETLSDATSATLELALVTSGPAARVGKEVLEEAVRLEPAPARLGLTLPSTGEAWRSVGLSVQEGVRPISGSARTAFGFLTPPRLRPAGLPAAPRPPRAG